MRGICNTELASALTRRTPHPAAAFRAGHLPPQGGKDLATAAQVIPPYRL